MGKKKSVKKSSEESGEASPPTEDVMAGGGESIKSVDLAGSTVSESGTFTSQETPLSTIETDNAAAAAPVDRGASPPASKGWGIGNAFKGLFGRAKAATTTIIPGAGPDMKDIVTDEAKKICGSGVLEGQGPCIDTRVVDLVWGWKVQMAVDRQNISFYRLTILANHIEKGFMLHGVSASRGNFKMLLFDEKGERLFCEDSVRSQDGSATTATVFLTKFDTYSLKKTPVSVENNSPVPGVGGAAAELSTSLFSPSAPSLFSKLDNLASVKSPILPAGQYLMCICGNNLLPGKTDVTLLAVTALTDGPELLRMQNADISLVHLKDSLSQLKTEYLQAKEAFESCISRMNEQERALYVKLQARDDSYRSFIDASALAFAPESYSAPRQIEAKGDNDEENEVESESAASASANAGTAPASSTGPSSKVDRDRKTASPQQVGIVMAGTPVEVVASTAAQAGGWIANKVTIGLGSLQQLVKNATAPPPSLSPFPPPAPGSSGADEASGVDVSVSESSELSSDPELEPIFAELSSAKAKFEKKSKSYRKLCKNAEELANRRAAQVEADKARFVKEAELSTESWLESFGLDDESRTKQESQARELAESLLRQRIAAFDQKAKEETAALAAEHSEKERLAAAEVEYSRVALQEMTKKKDLEVARVAAVREAERKAKAEAEAQALVEKLSKEAQEDQQSAQAEDEENVKRQQLAKQWAEQLERERVANSEAAAREAEEKARQMGEAKKAAEKLAEERRIAEEKKQALQQQQEAAAAAEAAEAAAAVTAAQETEAAAAAPSSTEEPQEGDKE